MEALAKAMTVCDNCKSTLVKKEDKDNQNIAATLENGKKEHQQYHFCDEECLRQYLNGRAKRKRATASVHVLEVEFPVQRNYISINLEPEA